MNGISTSSLKRHYRSSGETASSNSSISSTDSLQNTGSGCLALFTFVEPVRRERHHYLDAEHQRNCRGTLEVSPLFREGMLLTAKEKGVNFPVVHFTDDPDSLESFLKSGKFLGEHPLGDHTVLHQGVYKEVRSISPETDTGFPENLAQLDSNTTSYVLLGFKSQDKTFSQMMVDTWKDWTGARFIYMYLPDELGLSRISFYHKEAPNSLSLFMYIVLVECRGITSSRHETTLLDFVQRLRVERMSGYTSVYSTEEASALK